MSDTKPSPADLQGASLPRPADRHLPDASAADELVALVEDLASTATTAASEAAVPWKVLIVDDEQSVHDATVFALAELTVLGCTLSFLHACDETQAEAQLAAHPDIAVILLDVVMEAEDSGLRLVRHVRERLGMDAVRIILHTGQAGYAPQTEVVQTFDINDYKRKSELTRTGYATTLIAAIRSFDQIRRIHCGNEAMERLVASANDVFGRQGVAALCEALVRHAGTLPHATGHVLVVVPGYVLRDGSRDPQLQVASASGRFADAMGSALPQLADQRVAEALAAAADQVEHVFGDRSVTLSLRDSARTPLLVHVETTCQVLVPFARRLYQVFAAQGATAFENARLLERLRIHAYVDQLTGLPNRSRFVNLIDEQLLRGRQDHTVAIIDVVQFSETNDSLGHASGDLLLRAIAGELARALGDAVVLARIAGDCFGLLGPVGLLDPVQLQAMLGRPFKVGAYALQVTTAIGLAHLGASQGSGLDAVKNANIALNQAKLRRIAYCYYNAEMEVATQDRMRIAYGLRRGIRSRELEMHFQPLVDLASGRVLGAEALLRWRTPDGTMIPPASFIPVAESTGLIHPIGEFVLRSVAQQLQQWCALGLRNFRIAINVSVEQFRAGDFVARVKAVIQEFALDAGMIELEITESMAMDDLDTVLATLRALKALGVSIAIDDFGTGYSSLAKLTQLPIDRLKIDRSFVAAIGVSEAAANLALAGPDTSIPGMIVRLGHELKLQVIAEGVETENEARILLALGCDEAQGYFYGRPVPPEVFGRWLAERGLLPQAGTGRTE